MPNRGEVCRVESGPLVGRLIVVAANRKYVSIMDREADGGLRPYVFGRNGRVYREEHTRRRFPCLQQVSTGPIIRYVMPPGRRSTVDGSKYDSDPRHFSEGL